VARVRFVKSAQRLGFSLDDVAGLLTLADGAHCREARRLGEKKLAEVRAKLADLVRMETVLAGLMQSCGKGGGKVDCPLIAALWAD
jgi:MerR family mercuric resistance operon transcriptional regulator